MRGLIAERNCCKSNKHQLNKVQTSARQRFFKVIKTDFFYVRSILNRIAKHSRRFSVVSVNSDFIWIARCLTRFRRLFIHHGPASFKSNSSDALIHNRRHYLSKSFSLGIIATIIVNIDEWNRIVYKTSAKAIMRNPTNHARCPTSISNITILFGERFGCLKLNFVIFGEKLDFRSIPALTRRRPWLY